MENTNKPSLDPGVPGLDLPNKNDKFPAHSLWAFLGIPLGLLAGGLLGGGSYALLTLLDPNTARLSYLLGLATTYGVFKSTQKWLIMKGE